jgi:hypothetical protein
MRIIVMQIRVLYLCKYVSVFENPYLAAKPYVGVDAITVNRVDFKLVQAKRAMKISLGGKDFHLEVLNQTRVSVVYHSSTVRFGGKQCSFLVAAYRQSGR